MQLLPITNKTESWVDFERSRIETLAQSPHVVDPAVLAQFPDALESITKDILQDVFSD